MTTRPAATRKSATTPQKAAAENGGDDTQRQLRIGRELADTTWRISVPVVLFAGIGIFADRSAGTRPWLTLAGMLIGFVAAGILVRQQLRRWPDTPVKPGSYERNRKRGDTDEEDKDYYSD